MIRPTHGTRPTPDESDRTRTTGGAASGAVVAGDHAWEPRSDRRTAVVLFLLVWAVYLATASYTTMQNTDSRAAAHAAWSLGTRGTVELPAEWDPEDVSWHVVVSDDATGEERLHVWRFPGPVFWAAPFYAAWSLIDDSPVPSHPDEMNYAPAGVAGATAAALAITVSFLTFRRLSGRRTAVVAALVLAFATSVWSISGNALWTHGLTHLGLASGVLLTASGRQAAGGLAFAVSILSRPQTAVVAAVVGLHRGLRQRSLLPVVVVGATAAVGVVALSLYSQAVFGTWIPVAGYPSGRAQGVATTTTSTTVSRIGEFLIDPRRGLLWYAPFLIFLVPGLVRAWRTSHAWVRSATVAGIIYTAVQLRVNVADGGTWFFAYRLPIELLVLASPLLLVAWQHGVRGHKVRELAFAATVAMAVGLQVLGVTSYSAAWFAEVRRGSQTELFGEPSSELET